MIIHNVEQHSPQWFALRLGVPTASCFGKIITPVSGELSKQAATYAHELVAETMLGYPVKNLDDMFWIERGQELEPQAVRMYEFTFDAETKPVGFMTTDDGQIGASPDRLVGADGIMEIKCCSPTIHMGYVLGAIEEKYKPQIQGQLYISGRQWCDWFAYHPELPPKRIRTLRDEEYIERLDRALRGFLNMKYNMIESLKAQGLFIDRRAFSESQNIQEMAANTP